jgi:hypothetical protein
MKNFILGFLFFCILPSFVSAQKGASELKTIELVSIFEARSQPYFFGGNPGCFSFVSETVDCHRSDLIYGILRAGDHWNWFQVRGVGARNKILNLGKLDWTDNFKIPVVEPYPPLKAGEQRKITVISSGKKGKDGAPGRGGLLGVEAEESRSGRERYPDLRAIIPGAPLRPPVSRPRASDKDNADEIVVKNKDDDYEPLHKVLPGNMYVLRVVDDKNNDF